MLIRASERSPWWLVHFVMKSGNIFPGEISSIHDWELAMYGACQIYAIRTFQWNNWFLQNIQAW